MNSSNEAQYAYVGGDLISVQSASLHISDLAIQRGYGVFDFFKIGSSHPYFLNDHLDRFYRSASIMKLEVPVSHEELKRNIRELMKRNGMSESGIKIILTGGYSPDGFQIAKANLLLTQHGLTLPSKEQAESGINIITHPYNKEFPEAKTINYSMGIWLNDLVKKAGAADVLYHDKGIISEFPRCNIFVVDHSGNVMTPARGILKGVTRKNVLDLAAKRYKTTEAEITLDELFSASEVFLTSTTKRILPVVSIDGRIVGAGRPGQIALALLQDLYELEKKDLQQPYI